MLRAKLLLLPSWSFLSRFAPKERQDGLLIASRHLRAIRFTQDRRPGPTSWVISVVPTGLVLLGTYTQDFPGFPVRSSGHIGVCGFLYGKPHEAHSFPQPQQEIRVRPGLLSASFSRPFGTGIDTSSGPVRFQQLLSKGAGRQEPIWVSLIERQPEHNRLILLVRR